MLGQDAPYRNLEEWPREESNLRAQVRSLPLYPLSYGAEPDDMGLLSMPDTSPGPVARSYFGTCTTL